MQCLVYSLEKQKFQMMVDRINDYDDKLNVLLLSLTAGAVGLNLVGANHLLLIDNYWNPQLELQAQDRLHCFIDLDNTTMYTFTDSPVNIPYQRKNHRTPEEEIANSFKGPRR